MTEQLDRRAFLKLAGLFSLGISVPPLSLLASQPQGNADQKNILIIVYDAFSAHNTTFFGYPRATTPNISRLAERAVVYHNHIAGGNYTTPGTASLLTGAYPWSHRAFNMNETVENSYLQKNLFSAFPQHHRLAYTHNPLADSLLTHLATQMDDHIPMEEFFFFYGRSVDTLLKSDGDISHVSWVRAFERSAEGHSYSLYLSYLYEKLSKYQKQLKLDRFEEDFPRGVPDVRGKYFLLEHGTDYLIQILSVTPHPFLGYFHFYPPHAPYATRADFYQQFTRDGYNPIDKPEHFFTENRSAKFMLNKRTEYDEYLLYVDEEFGRLYDALESSGLLENTWLILTSDHGEMFERGIVGHTTPVLNQPLIHTPLLVFEPGRKQRQDIITPTSATDILPTLLHVHQQPIPDWIEGTVLPPFAPENSRAERSLYSMDIRGNNKRAAITKGSIALVRAPYKLSYYFNRKELEPVGGELIELCDLENDPEEMQNLYPGNQALAKQLLDELKSSLEEANQLVS